MMILMVDLVILVMLISDRASDVKIQTQGEMKECEAFNVSLYIRGFYELNPRIHVNYSGYNRVCIYDKKIGMKLKIRSTGSGGASV